MITLAIMLLLLTFPYVLLTAAGRSSGRPLVDGGTSGTLGITLVFCFTALGHFVATDAMVAMLPPWFPAQRPIVYATGVLEFVAALAVLVPRWRRVVAWGLIVLLAAFLPVNIYAAIHRMGMGGHQWGPIYLLLRVPVQAILAIWIWWFAARKRPIADTTKA